MTPSILDRASAADICRDPFPHLVVRNALPEDHYAALAASFPAIEEVAGPGPLENNTLYLLSALDVVDNPHIAEVWRAFFARHTAPGFFAKVLDLWEPEMRRLHPEAEGRLGKRLRDFSTALRQPGKKENAANRVADIMLDCQFGVNSPVTRESSVRGAHLDNPAKLFAALLYFRRPDDDSAGGELQFFRIKGERYPETSGSRIDERHLEPALRVPYEANTLVMWVNSPYSIHGVTPRSVTSVPRQYINFLGECYNAASRLSFTDVAHGPAPWWRRALAAAAPRKAPWRRRGAPDAAPRRSTR